MNPSQLLASPAALFGGLALVVLVAPARADEIFVASPSTLILKGNPFSGAFTTIGACGGAAHSMTLNGTQLLIGDPNGHVYKKSPSDAFVSYAFDVPNDAQALVMHAGNLLSGGSDGTVVRVDAASGAVLATLNAPVPVTAMLVSGDDLYLGSSFGIVEKGNALTGGFQFWGTCGGPVNSLAIDSTHLILGSSNSQVYRINLQTQAVDATFPVSNTAEAMLVHAGDLLIGGSNATILRVQRTTGLLKGTITAPASVSALAILEVSDPGLSYCYGTGCPCGNDDPEAGCAHSRGYGSRVAGQGSTSVAADDLAVFAYELPLNKNGRFYMSQGSTMHPLGDGLLCAGGGGYPPLRFAFENSGPTGTLQMPPDLIAYCAQRFPNTGQIFPGSTWHFQAWYRDPAGPCGARFNTTSSYVVTFGP